MTTASRQSKVIAAFVAFLDAIGWELMNGSVELYVELCIAMKDGLVDAQGVHYRERMAHDDDHEFLRELIRHELVEVVNDDFGKPAAYRIVGYAEWAAEA